jgi:molybdopterin molybdotransferase
MSVPVHDCRVEASADAVRFEAARSVAAALAAPLDRHEDVALADALGRTLAKPIRAPRSLPPFDQAAMDGYAVRMDVPDALSRTFPVIGRTRAGDIGGVLAEGAAHRILTGGALPRGADTVVMEEHTTRRDDLIRLGADAVAGDNIRKAGEDISEGETVFQAGRVIGWPEIALLAALGIGRIAVAGPLRIAMLTTGSELHEAGAPLPPGAIYNSNGPMLAALLAGPDIRLASFSVHDDAAALTQTLGRMAEDADLIITTAGMSVSEEDHVRGALSRLGGRLDVGKVAMKPGKPLGLGRLRDACFLGLPGNPQAAACGALAFGRPMIDRLLGRPPARPLMASMAFPHAGKPDRTELLPVHLAVENGRLTARPSGAEGSHRLMPIVSADAIAVLPDAAAPAEAGANVEILPFDRLRFCEDMEPRTPAGDGPAG